MSHRAHFGFGLGLALSMACFACGDDDGESKPSTPDSGTSGSGGNSGTNSNTVGGRGSVAGGGGSAGTAGAGDRAEGDQCMTDGQCASGLRCTMAAVGEVGVRICARPCTTDDECGEEVCASPYTQLEADAHCINLNPAPFAICGVGETSLCDGRTCLYFPSSTVGVCVDLCSADGPDADAGVPTEVCTAPNSCIPDIVDNPAVGICGEQVARGALCGVESGKFCATADVCVADDIANPASESHCREDCSTSRTCATGTCTNFRGMFSYCKP